MSLQQTSILYNNTLYPHYYLCNYLPVSVGKDTLSHSLLKFKRGRQPDLNGWIDCSQEMLANNPRPPDATTIPPDSIIIRALHHEETLLRENAPPASLDKLGSALAHQFKGRYLPHLLRKSLPTQQIKGLSKEQREAELQGLYSLHPAPAAPSASPIAPPSGQPTPSFLIIDDILTTGTTMKMIIGAILRSYPKANLLIFTLAKADYDTSFNRSTPLQGQNYQLEPGRNWVVAEEEAFFYSLDQLKGWIRADTC
jgi:predicted amidophosphoribosyltransferase